jgi:hypothetical protein
MLAGRAGVLEGGVAAHAVRYLFGIFLLALGTKHLNLNLVM